MDVRDGFIVGIFNYCDRWCEACAFTSRCRLFADRAETDASFDPGLRALVASQALFREKAPSPPPWLEELLEGLDEAISRQAHEAEPIKRPLPPEHVAIEDRARRYCQRACRWLQGHEAALREPPTDPRAVVSWFHTLLPAKIHRALQGLVDAPFEERDWPSDYDGSAKVALLGIERSHTAWGELRERGWPAHPAIESCMADLVWLRDELERVFPNARAFVRPGLDEPDDVARLSSGLR